MHWEKLEHQVTKHINNPLRGVTATSYLVEFQNKRWLFPGDTRTYDASQLPSFGPVDGLFAHLWLGCGCALMGEPPLLDSFCHFYLDLQPSRIFLTYINEFGRDADDFWDESHVKTVRSKFREISENIPISNALLGENILL